jgi:hypothetical protein
LITVTEIGEHLAVGGVPHPADACFLDKFPLPGALKKFISSQAQVNYRISARHLVELAHEKNPDWSMFTDVMVRFFFLFFLHLIQFLGEVFAHN